MMCTHEKVCRFAQVEEGSNCLHAVFCKHATIEGVIKVVGGGTVKHVTQKKAEPAKKTGRGRPKNAGKTAKQLDTSEEGIAAARARLSMLAATGCLSDNQMEALEQTKGVFFRKMTDAQKEQIISIYNDAVTEHRGDRE